MGTQAVILAAGQGTRLAPYTDDRPKTLVEVGGRRMLDLIVERILSVGISDIIVAIGHMGQLIVDHVETHYPQANFTFVHNPLYKETNSTYSLWLTQEYIRDDIVVINADTLFSRGILSHLLAAEHDISLSIDFTLVGELPPDNMKVTIVDGLIKDASKLIPAEDTHGDAIGVYRFKGDGIEALFAKLEQLVDVGTLDQLFTFAVRSIMRETNVYPVSTGGLPWIEIDDTNDLRDAEEIVRQILREDADAA